MARSFWSDARSRLRCSVSSRIAVMGRDAHVWPLVSLGSLYLAADETLEIHESIGHYAHDGGVPRPPLLNGYGDAVLLLYELLVLCVAWRYRAELFRHWRSTQVLMLAVAFLVLSELVDFFGVHQGRERFWWSVTEVSSKMIGFGLILGALIDRLQFEMGRTASGGARSQ